MHPDLREGTTFGAYHLIAVVGMGGMGVVYRAEQRPLGRVVALKVIRPEIAESGDYRARFLREARLAAAVDHPHIVPVFDFGEHAGRLYLTMQWIDGAELQSLIESQQRLEPARAVRIGAQIASALDAIHQAGMLHRDVKPANIVVRDIGGDDHAYLTDFGIAKIAQAQGGLTRTGWIIGTSGYLSPEQVRGRQPDARSDLYALGCVMFVALTGRAPFTADNDQAVLWAHANGPRPIASEFCPDLGRRYDEFLIRALAVDPCDRFQSGREFGAALEAAHEGTPGDRNRTDVVASAESPAPTQPSAHAPGTAASAETETETTHAHVAGTEGSAAPGRLGERRPAAAHPRAGRQTRGYMSRLITAVGCLVFFASVTVMHSYINSGAGWKSLWEATHGDITSPLYSDDFWLSVALAGFVLVATAATIPLHGRLPMGVVTVAALGLTGYTLYIPTIGASPGLGPYGESYWLSLAAAVVMTLGAGAAAIRSRKTRNLARWP